MNKFRGFFVFLSKSIKMKKIMPYLLVFLLGLSSYLIYSYRHLINAQHKLQIELNETNEGYDNNIQYAIQLEDSITNLKKVIDSLQQTDYFSLEGNKKSQAYLNEAFETEKKWSEYIKIQLLKTNKNKKGDNPLIPFAGMDGPMRIDKLKVLNHRWIIAHFTDGTYQGSIILRYDINPDGQIIFKVLDQTLYK